MRIDDQIGAVGGCRTGLETEGAAVRDRKAVGDQISVEQVESGCSIPSMFDLLDMLGVLAWIVEISVLIALTPLDLRSHAGGCDGRDLLITLSVSAFYLVSYRAGQSWLDRWSSAVQPGVLGSPFLLH